MFVCLQFSGEYVGQFSFCVQVIGQNVHIKRPRHKNYAHSRVPQVRQGGLMEARYMVADICRCNGVLIC